MPVKSVMLMFGRPGRELVDVDALDAERRRRLVPKSDWNVKGVRLRIADAQLVDERDRSTRV